MNDKPSDENDKNHCVEDCCQTPYADGANRLERVIDLQIETINDIDTKAEHVNRLLGLLIGVVLSAVSIVAQLEGVQLSEAAPMAQLAFFLGILALLASMGAAVITYLSSRVEAGLSPAAGYHLSNPNTQTTMDEHIRRVLGSYAHIVDANRDVIQTNSRRFRLTLLFLLVGVIYLAASAGIYLSGVRGLSAISALAVVSIAILGLSWYILTGRYLTIESQD